MSAACAERVNIMRLVDTRWAGIAKGVGVQRIIGRIHMVQVAIENDYLTTSFSVLEEQPMDMLLGLDMLKRHQASTLSIRHIKKLHYGIYFYITLFKMFSSVMVELYFCSKYRIYNYKC